MTSLKIRLCYFALAILLCLIAVCLAFDFPGGWAQISRDMHLELGRAGLFWGSLIGGFIQLFPIDSNWRDNGFVNGLLVVLSLIVFVTNGFY